MDHLLLLNADLGQLVNDYSPTTFEERIISLPTVLVGQSRHAHKRDIALHNSVLSDSPQNYLH